LRQGADTGAALFFASVAQSAEQGFCKAQVIGSTPFAGSKLTRCGFFMKLLVQILIRRAIANQPANPREWLMDLQATKWTTVNAQTGQIVGTSVNGKSVSLQAIPGINLADLFQATEIALQTIEAGLTSPASEYQGLAR